MRILFIYQNFHIDSFKVLTLVTTKIFDWNSVPNLPRKTAEAHSTLSKDCSECCSSMRNGLKCSYGTYFLRIVFNKF